MQFLTVLINLCIFYHPEWALEEATKYEHLLIRMRSCESNTAAALTRQDAVNDKTPPDQSSAADGDEGQDKTPLLSKESVSTETVEVPFVANFFFDDQGRWNLFSPLTLSQLY